MSTSESSSMSTLPLINLEPFLNDSSSVESLSECKKVTKALIDYGCFVVKDPRVSESTNEEFLDLIEQYYGQGEQKVMEDARPEVGYQVGVTPPSTEDPRCKTDAKCLDIIEKLPESDKPLLSSGPDPKWRYAWRIGMNSKNQELELLNHDQVIPKGFPTWEKTMDQWGQLLHQAVATISEMAAIGFDLKRSTFLDLIKGGAHLLSPTGSDLSKHDKKDTILAGFHYDLCFLTIHGRSRFPGLNIWSQNNSHKTPVKVPKGYLLVQAGKQFEWSTGGIIKAGYHEVIVNENTIKAIELKKQEGGSLWRISSTLFNHIQSDLMMRPVDGLTNWNGFNNQGYPEIKAHDYVINELAGINLFGSQQLKH